MTTMSGERLSPDHLDHLQRGSGIDRAVIDARGYETFINTRGLPAAVRGKFPDVPGLLIPIWDTMGRIRTYQFRPDYPEPDPKTGRIAKYLNPSGGLTCIDVPAACLPYLDDVEADLWITEGSKKVDSAVSHGLPSIIGLLGVAMWQRGKGKALPDWNDITLEGRRVIICFDSDVMTNPKVRNHLDGLAAYLDYRGARVNYCILPGWDGTVYP